MAPNYLSIVNNDSLRRIPTYHQQILTFYKRQVFTDWEIITFGQSLGFDRWTLARFGTSLSQYCNICRKAESVLAGP